MKRRNRDGVTAWEMICRRQRRDMVKAGRSGVPQTGREWGRGVRKASATPTERQMNHDRTGTGRTDGGRQVRGGPRSWGLAT